LIDAWLDGYTPDYATAVWMGYPNKRVEMTDVHGQAQQGGYLPAEIWHAYMSAVVEGKPCVPFQPSREAISYRPFYGHFATTGEAELPRFEPPRAKAHGKPSEHNGGRHQAPEGIGGGGTTRSPSQPTPPPLPQAPTAPPNAPNAPATGGAAPGG
jgi:membrane peptidoglycan carboxypeptidase